MKNKETIEQLQSFVNGIEQKNPSRRDIVDFNLQDVEINGEFKYRDLKFEEAASDKILDILNAKPSFKEYRQLMEEKDWKNVSRQIKTAKGDINLYGSLIPDKMGGYVVDDIYFRNPKKKQPDDLTTPKAIVETICEELSTSMIDWSLANSMYNEDKNLFEISLRNENNPVEVLAGDSWKKGEMFSFNSTNFKQCPFYERLICSNGMTKPSYGFSSNISKVSFNNQKVQKVINNALAADNDSVSQMIAECIKHAKGTNVSIREFYEVRNFFDKKGYSVILDKYFIEAPLYSAYGTSIADKNKQWQSTADSGINAYDFINLITWIASHTDKSNISKEDAAKLKIHAGWLFTLPKFDLEHAAPKVDIKYPRFVEMD